MSIAARTPTLIAAALLTLSAGFSSPVNAQAAALLEGDHYFRLRSWLDQVFSGAALQGLNYWAWAELPRAYLLAKCRLELGRWEQAQADIDRLLPELGHLTPAVSDDFPERIREREAEMRAIWAGCSLRNDRIRAATGMSFRPLDESLRDCVESLLAIAGTRPVLRPGHTLPD